MYLELLVNCHNVYFSWSYHWLDSDLVGSLWSLTALLVSSFSLIYHPVTSTQCPSVTIILTGHDRIRQYKTIEQFVSLTGDLLPELFYFIGECYLVSFVLLRSFY